MLDKFIFVLTQKLALLFVAGLSVVGGFLATTTASPGTHANLAAASQNIPQTAIASGATTPSFSDALIADVPDIPIGLLPTSTEIFCTASSTCGQKNIKILLKSFVAIKKIVAMATSTPAKKPAAIAPVNTAITVTTNMLPVTAQSFLNDTTVSVKTLLNGLDEAVFTTDLGNQNKVAWNLLSTTVGGAGSVPEFSITSSCTPIPHQADPDALDQNPMLDVRTAYDCTVSLTPQSGTDRRTQTKDFSFTTPPGKLVVTRESSMNSVLVNDINNGGIVFDNQDTNPITITGVTFDATYANLTTLESPLVLRFLDPATEQSLADYHLENLPADPSAPYTFSQSNITVPLSFTVGALSQKVLPMQSLGVHKMLMTGTSPAIKITVRSVSIDRSDIKTVVNNPVVEWSCTVALGGYDPNATSGVYAMGQACLN